MKAFKLLQHQVWLVFLVGITFVLTRFASCEKSPTNAAETLEWNKKIAVAVVHSHAAKNVNSDMSNRFKTPNILSAPACI